MNGSEPAAKSPGAFAEAATAFRRCGPKLVAAAALALVPASLVAGGAVYVATRAAEMRPLTAGADETAGRAQKAAPDQGVEARQNLLREPAQPGSAAAQPPGLAWRAAGIAFAAFALITGILLAQGALVALALGEGCAQPALGAAGPRVWTTALCASAIVVAGFVCLLLPGIVFAVGFSLAMPVAVFECAPAPLALSRSWRLCRRVWPELLALVALPAAAVLAVEAAFRVRVPFARAAIDAAVLVVALPLPLVLSGFVYLRARSDLDRVPLAQLRQYIRRISAPG